MTLAGAVAFIIAAVFVLAPFAIQGFVVLQFFFSLLHVVTMASAICRKSAVFMTADNTAAGLVRRDQIQTQNNIGDTLSFRN